MQASFILAVIALLAVNSYGYSVPAANKFDSSSSVMARRQAMTSLFGGSIAFLGVSSANALDMDAFANSQLEADEKNCNPKVDPKCAPPMTKDEALCKYGQSGEARGDACKRVKQAGGSLPSAKPQGKSLGGAYAM
jgi:hypothetical protein